MKKPAKRIHVGQLIFFLGLVVVVFLLLLRGGGQEALPDKASGGAEAPQAESATAGQRAEAIRVLGLSRLRALTGKGQPPFAEKEHPTPQPARGFSIQRC